MVMTTAAVGNKVTELRMARGLTTTDLAKKVGISQAQISRLENGKQGFRWNTMLKFSKALGVDPVIFLVEGGPVTKPNSVVAVALADPGFAGLAELLAKAYLDKEKAEALRVVFSGLSTLLK